MSVEQIMEDNMSKCKHKLRIHQWSTGQYKDHYRKPPYYSASPAPISEECGKPIYDEYGFCVFHSKKSNKTQDFIKELSQRILKNKNDKFDFRGFYFPEDFSFTQLIDELNKYYSSKYNKPKINYSRETL